MASTKKSTELKAILNIIEKYENGVQPSTILEQLPTPISQRTLLRRLWDLKNEQKIVSSGSKSATRYFLIQNYASLELSKNSEALKNHVCQSLEKRKPVSYNPDFLFRYIPNATFYLYESERQHLKNKGQQFSQKLLPSTFVKHILQKLLIDLAWNSSRLEGNTYSLLETERLLAFGAKAASKPSFEAQMILNHKEAINFMISEGELHFNKSVILNLHSLLANNLLRASSTGQLRKCPVGIGRSVYYPLEVHQLIEEYFNVIISKAEEILDPFEQAFFAMVHLPYLQPFDDINKSVSRLSANIPLFNHNLSPLSFTDVPKEDYISGLQAIYELNNVDLLKEIFIWAYERSALKFKFTPNVVQSPDVFYMQYSTEIKTLVQSIVKQNVTKVKLIEAIQVWTDKNIVQKDKEKFIRIVESELASLHLGNIAVYRLKEKEYLIWKNSIIS